MKRQISITTYEFPNFQISKWLFGMIKFKLRLAICLDRKTQGSYTVLIKIQVFSHDTMVSGKHLLNLEKLAASIFREAEKYFFLDHLRD
jgi:hypothetical protein